MVLASVLFVLLTALGSWRVWQRSPAYSLKLTVQIFGVCASILALFLFVAYVPLPEAEHTVLAIGCLLLCVLGAPVLILRFTAGRVAELPVSIQVLSIHRTKVQHWIWRLLVFVAVCAGSALLLKGDLIWLPITLGGFCALCATGALILLYMRATRLDRGLSIVLDNPWIHWQYTPEEWTAWANLRLKRDESENSGFSWNRDWRKYTKIFCELLQILFLCSWLAFSVGIAERILISLGLSFFLVGALVAVAVSTHAGNDRRYRKMVAAVADTYVGEEGIYSGGEFTPWTLSGSYLVEAMMEAGPPPHIRFVFQTNIKETKDLLISAGHEAELELLQQKIQAKIPTAKVCVAMPQPLEQPR